MHCVICAVHPLFAAALSPEALAAHNAAEQERIRQEELFAEIERDWYADEETPIRTEDPEDDPLEGEKMANNTPEDDGQKEWLEEFGIFEKEHVAKDERELLPNYQSAKVDDRKVSGYTLNMEHSLGRHKAIAFQKALGYTVENKDLLLDQVYQGLQKYRAEEKPGTEYGRPFEVAMIILGANGKYARVKTAWLIDHGAAEPRLISMYVD